MKTNYYAEHTRALKEELLEAVDRGRLRSLHERSAARHLLVAARQTALLAVAVAGVLYFRDGWGWIPFAVVEGWTIFNFTVLLHEVVHGLVFQSPRPRLSRALGL